MSELVNASVKMDTRPLSSMALIDPESLPLGTPPHFSFRYVDIASIVDRRVRPPDREIEYRNAPSRARRVIRSGDVLMSTVRPNLKAFAYCDLPIGNFIASTGFAVLRAIDGNDPRFILYSVLSDTVAQQIESHAVGSNYPAINSSDVRRLELPFCKPAQQRRIAEILSTLDETIEQTEALIAKYQQIKAGLMHDLFTRGVTPDGKLRPARAEAPHLYKQSPLGWIPQEWEVNTTGKLCTSIVPGRNKPLLDGGELPWITVSDIDADSVSQSKEKLSVSRKSLGDALGRSVPAGAVIMSCVGDFGITTQAGCEVVINQQLHAFLPGDRIIPSWLMLFLRSQREFMERVATQTTIKYLNKAGCESVHITVPRVDEQVLITDRIQRVIALQETERLRREKLFCQKHGLMHDLLTGRVRVKVDG